MQITRRDFMKLGGAAAAVTAAPVWAETGLRPRPSIAWKAQTPDQMPEPDFAALLLNRAAFGPRPGDVELVRGNESDWIEDQIDFASIDDSAVTQRVTSELSTVGMMASQLLSRDQGEQVISELNVATMYRMVMSPRLLHETLVEFWSDHFTIFHRKDNCRYLKTVDDRDVIRVHALGNFKALLTASAQSPAMLHFLDNDVSRSELPNENYAREIMELHSVGVAVDGYPYTEEDVKEVARCFTGWSYNNRATDQRYGLWEFRATVHDNGSKNVLGSLIPASGGVQDGHNVIDILVHHEATPKYLAYKLVRRYVTDNPTEHAPDLLQKVERAYVLSDGSIPDMMRTIFHSAEFRGSFSALGGRLSRPMDLIARALRALDLQEQHLPSLTAGFNNIVGGRGFLNAMGHVPFNWPTPDGYPDVGQAWTASATMLARWNMGLAAAGAVDRPGLNLVPGFNPLQVETQATTAGETVDFWIDRVLHRPMLDADRAVLIDYLTRGGTEFDPMPQNTRQIAETVALILDSPYFQWR